MLSIEEAYDYLYHVEERKAAPTPYAVKHGSDVSEVDTTNDGENTGWWWLRSPGYYRSSAACVSPDGSVHKNGASVVDSSVSIRPALWLNLKPEDT